MIETSRNRYFDTAFQRLRAIPWSEAGMKDGEIDLTAILALWLERLQIVAEARMIDSENPFTFDFAAHIAPDVPVATSVDDWLNVIRPTIPTSPYRICALLRATLHWYQIMDPSVYFGDIPMETVYEPTIAFFEAGGGIRVEHAMFYEIYPAGVTFIQPQVGVNAALYKKAKSETNES